MSSPTKQDALPIAVDDEVSSRNAETVELCSLSGDKPFFHVDLAKSHVNSPYFLYFQAHTLEFLPGVNVPAVLKHGNKTWNLSYVARSGKIRSRFDNLGWKKFVVDNNLKCGDGCIFEVLESTPRILRIKVVILRNVACLPSELQANSDVRGTTLDTAIELN